jgi:hypothetical protein
LYASVRRHTQERHISKARLPFTVYKIYDSQTYNVAVVSHYCKAQVFN